MGISHIVCPRRIALTGAWRPRARGGARFAAAPFSSLSPPFPPFFPKPPPALALIPDDDDVELITKARANRTKRLAEEKESEVKFTAGARGSPLAGAQAAVATLQKAGAQLDSGDAAGAAATLEGGTWVAGFATSAARVGGASASAAAAEKALAKLQAEAGGAGVKPAYVAAAKAVAGWAADAGVAASLKGL